MLIACSSQYDEFEEIGITNITDCCSVIDISYQNKTLISVIHYANLLEYIMLTTESVVRHKMRIL